VLEIPLPTRRATRRLATALAGVLTAGDIVWLEGDLGAGKTFFARGLLRALGVPHEIPVTSPTFALVHEHRGRLPILHLDLYRLAHEEEVRALGLDEAIDQSIAVVEWGARFRTALGARGLQIRLQFTEDPGGRIAEVLALDARGETIAQRLAAR
jgi:tRNA threonylcarbamoyladenosine biosynthesis protein TsaE